MEKKTPIKTANDGEAGEVGGPQSRCFGDGAANDRHAEEVGLDLHQEIVRRGSAVHAKFGEAGARVAVHGVQEIGDLEGHALERRAGDVGRGRAAGEADCLHRSPRATIGIEGQQEDREDDGHEREPDAE